jgi:Trypsin-co-occurring domain 1
MSDIQRLQITENGKSYDLFIENKSIPDFQAPASPSSTQRPGSMGPREDAIVKMQQARQMIRGYVTYALSAFEDFEGANIEEVNLKFGLKIGGKAGIPYITEGSAESNLEISVKCTFPKAPNR